MALDPFGGLSLAGTGIGGNPYGGGGDVASMIQQLMGGKPQGKPLGMVDPSASMGAAPPMMASATMQADPQALQQRMAAMAPMAAPQDAMAGRMGGMFGSPFGGSRFQGFGGGGGMGNIMNMMRMMMPQRGWMNTGAMTAGQGFNERQTGPMAL